MLDIILHESFKSIRLLFTQPVLYWAIFLLIISSYERIERERLNFGYKIFDVSKEFKDTLTFSLIFGTFVSLIMVGFGFVFLYETIYLINIVIIIYSISCRYTLLSASYTMGTVYLLILLLPIILSWQSYFPTTLFTEHHLSGFVILLGLLLLGEAFLLKQTKANTTYPSLRKSKRGAWVGLHHLRKLSVLPLFLLVPHGLIEPLTPFWPVIDFGVQSYSVIIFPMVIGFDHRIKGSLPHVVSQRLAQSIIVLAFIVIAIGVGSIYVTWLSFIAVLVAVIGREFIKYKLQAEDDDLAPYFTYLDEGVIVLGVIPKSPAEKLGILVGETIVRVNGRTVRTPNEFYRALHESGAFFKLDVLDEVGEIRFVQGAFYEDDDHNLGIIFPQERYHVYESKAIIEKTSE